MEPPSIRYTRTEDGVSIAWMAAGEGPPVVVLPNLYSDLGVEWEPSGPMHDQLEVFVKKGHTVTFDWRGNGRSARDPSELGPETLQLDIEAVVRAAGFDRFVLVGRGSLGAAAIQYVVENPERVTRLALMNIPIAPVDTNASAVYRALVARDRQLFAETVADIWRAPDASRDWVVRWVRDCVEPDVLQRRLLALEGYSVEMLLSQVAVPTVVWHPSTGRAISNDDAHRIAAGIPDAQLIMYSGDSVFPTRNDLEQMADAFFATTTTKQTPAGSGGFQTILFTDLEASTPLTQRLGDEGAQELLRGHNTSVRGALEEHGGREVKHTGDGIMASFPSAVAAVTAALQIQRELTGGEVRVRVGLNAGEPIAEDDDLFGTSVILAARVTDRAEPGQILVTRVVADLCAGKRFGFRSLGGVTLKGFSDSVELFEVTA